MPWGINVNGSIFAREFVGRKATRGIRKFLQKISTENFIYVIENDRDLISFFTPEQQHQFRLQYKVPREYADAFTDDEVYSWIPSEYINLFKSVPGGEAWARRQIGFIRQFIMPS